MIRLALVGTSLVCLLQLILWCWQVRTKNAGWVDVGWALGLGILACFFAIWGSGDPARRALVAAMGSLHGFRLGFHLWRRVAMDLHEDGRYQTIRANWKTRLNLKFFFFFQFQALLDVFLAVPFLLASMNPRPGLHLLEWIALGLWVVSWIGESFADAQLRAFKAKPESKGKTCRAGLWRYSRHPNYFFEWLVWVAYALLAFGAPLGWIAVACPLVMLYFLLFVTGIPYTEAQSLKSRPEDYRRYQRETSAFFPWFPKKADA
jgi:steroid 5-alpha reductase family enzyme